MSTILTTGRLILRPPVAGDARAIADILNDWEVTKWLTMVPFPYTLAEAARAVLDWHFAKSGEDALSGYHIGNAASARVQEKLGFHKTHEVMHNVVSSGKEVVVVRTALTRERWDALRNAGR